MSTNTKLKELIKDGCILKNRIGYEFIAMPSLDRDISIEVEEIADSNQNYRPLSENMPLCLSMLNDELESNGGKGYDIVEIRYMNEVIWKRV